MDKENKQHGNSYLSKHYALSSRHVPSILRRRRRSQNVPALSETSDDQADSLTQRTALQPLTQSETQTIDNTNRNASGTSPKLMTSNALHQQLGKFRPDFVKLGLIRVVTTTTAHDMRVSRKRVLDDFVTERQKTKARVECLAVNKRQRGLHISKKGRPGGLVAQRLVSLTEVNRQKLSLGQSSDVALGLQHLVTGTSQVLKYLSKKTDGSPARE